MNRKEPPPKRAAGQGSSPGQSRRINKSIRHGVYRHSVASATVHYLARVGRRYANDLLFPFHCYRCGIATLDPLGNNLRENTGGQRGGPSRLCERSSEKVQHSCCLSLSDASEWKADDGKKRLSLSFIAEQLNLLPNNRAKPADSTAPTPAPFTSKERNQRS